MDKIIGQLKLVPAVDRIAFLRLTSTSYAAHHSLFFIRISDFGDLWVLLFCLVVRWFVLGCRTYSQPGHHLDSDTSEPFPGNKEGSSNLGLRVTRAAVLAL